MKEVEEDLVDYEEEEEVATDAAAPAGKDVKKYVVHSQQRAPCSRRPLCS